MIMACATGKTFTTLSIKEALEAHTTLVLLSMAVYAPAPVRGLDKGAASPSNAVRPATAGSAANSQIGRGVSVVQYCSAFYKGGCYQPKPTLAWSETTS